MTYPQVDNELDLLEALVPLKHARIIEAGCGAARLARDLVARHADAAVVGIDLDERQLAKNLQQPVERLQFERAGAQAIPFAAASFDGALMLKSLHHVPLPEMELALAALDRAIASGVWMAADEHRFETPVKFASFEDFEQRMMRPTFADHRIDDAMLDRVRARYAPHQRPDGAHFTRPMHVRLLRKTT